MSVHTLTPGVKERPTTNPLKSKISDGTQGIAYQESVTESVVPSNGTVPSTF